VWADVSHAEWDRFSTIVQAHAAHLHDYCRSLLTDRRDAADAAQATLVIAFALLDRLQDTGRIRAWLLALARRECRSADPVRSRLPPRALGSPSAEPDADEQRIRRPTAGAALNALPAVEREVLDLVYRHYLSSADVGAVLGVPSDRASALLASGVTDFDRMHQPAAHVNMYSAQPEGTAEALVAGVRSICRISLVALPPAILAGATSMVLDPGFASYRESLASTAGDLGPDGFPVPPQHVHPGRGRGPVGQRAVLQRAVLQRAVLQRAVLHRVVLQGAARAGRVPRARLALIGALLVALGAAIAVMAGSSGVPNARTHAIGQTFGQMSTSRVSTRRPMPPLPITALLPKKQDQGIMLPMLPAGPSPASSHRPHPAPSTGAPSPTPSPTPTSASPSPTATPSSPSPTPTSPSPSSPPPTPTVTP
jgi:RNA polymerase sigma factor (sigma-70 family)